MRFGRLKPLFLLGAFLLAWLILPTGIKRMLRSGLYELQAPALVSASYLQDLQVYWSERTRSQRDLIEVARDLSRVNAAYELQTTENAALRAEIARLENALNLPSEPAFHYEVARVVRRDLGTWWQQIIIRKGRLHGLREGMAVVYGGGVVGIVRNTEAYTAQVELVSSPRFRMAANFAGDARPVTYQGAGQGSLGQPIGQVRDVLPDIRLQPGQPLRLVSSSKGGVFPQGLPVGEVTALEIGSNGLFQRGPVRLNEDLRSIQEVSVLIPIELDSEQEALP